MNYKLFCIFSDLFSLVRQPRLHRVYEAGIQGFCESSEFGRTEFRLGRTWGFGLEVCLRDWVGVPSRTAPDVQTARSSGLLVSRYPGFQSSRSLGLQVSWPPVLHVSFLLGSSLIFSLWDLLFTKSFVKPGHERSRTTNISSIHISNIVSLNFAGLLDSVCQLADVPGVPEEVCQS